VQKEQDILNPALFTIGGIPQPVGAARSCLFQKVCLGEQFRLATIIILSLA